MEFSTQTTASLHQIKTSALAVGVFADGILSPAADVVDRAGGGALRAVLKSEFKAKPNTHLVLRNVPGVTAARVVLIGLGKQEAYGATVHAGAELAFATYCVGADLTEGVSALAATECPDTTLRSRTRAAAVAGGRATYQYKATVTRDAPAAPRLKKIGIWVARTQATEAQNGLREGQAVANGMNLTRMLGDLPPNVCTPTYLGNTAKKLAKEFKSLKAEIL
ncbi:MAG TPA: M17 family peptidase N-terminal domain-containing protein, partial [Burkholderiaceae bacterium]|nr:M17 family peptidase N-terminal domain-containing protein [Burkholderiaceae bacterium]